MLCGLLSSGYKLFLCKIKVSDQVQEILQRLLSVEGNQGKVVTALYFLESLVSEIVINSHLNGFFNYTTIISEFNKQLIDLVFQTAYKVASDVLAGVLLDSISNLELIKASQELLFAVLTFPYENSFISFSTECNLSEHNQTMYPFRWADKLLNVCFLENLASVALMPQIGEDLRVLIMQNISWLASTKHDMSQDPNLLAMNLKCHLKYPEMLISSYTQSGRIPSCEVVESLLDQMIRLIKTNRILRLARLKTEFLQWIDVLLLLSKFVYKSFSQFSNKTINLSNQVWEAIIDQSHYLDFGVKDFQLALIDRYLESCFYEERPVNVFKDSDEFVPEKLEDTIQKRFKPFKEIFGSHKEHICEKLLNLTAHITEYGKLVQSSVAENHGQGALLYLVKDFLTKYCHFTILATFIFFADTEIMGMYQNYINKLNDEIASLTNGECEKRVQTVKAEIVSQIINLLPLFSQFIPIIDDVLSANTGKYKGHDVHGSRVFLHESQQTRH